MILGESNGKYIYRTLGLTSISPDYESISHMMEVAENFNMKYHIVDPNDRNSIGLNPFVYDNPLKAAGVFSYVLKAMYQGTLDNIDKVNLENDAIEALENTCTLLKVSYPIIYKDRDYLPTLEDVLKIFRNMDAVEDLCKKLESMPEIAEDYTMSEDEAMREFIILGLRVINMGVNKAEFEKRFSRSVDDVFSEQLMRFKDFFVNDKNALKLKEEAALVSNSILCEFMN